MPLQRVAAALLVFALSIDDYVITSFVAGVGTTTLPIQIYSMVRTGISPEINAVSTLLLVATSVLLFAAYRLEQGKSARSAAVPALVGALKDAGNDRAVRNRAAESLGNLGPDAKAAVPALIAALKDKNAIVRIVAADSFKSMGTEAKSAVPALLEAAKDKVEEVRKNAIDSLEFIDPEAAKKAKQ